jgi:hypothetical protein|tara:strand:- start:2808 stop:3428 length:621 start_codon:yes stop_codon:yes gene_type:complete
VNDITPTIKDYMGIFPHAASKAFCENLIKWFEQNNREGRGGVKKTLSRQQAERDMSKTRKDSELYWLGLDSTLVGYEHPMLKEFDSIVWKSYAKFEEVYGTGLNSIGAHKLSTSIKIQRYAPTQGYHVWHPDVTCNNNSGRILVCLLYLNTIKEGGETEFLYQKMRVPAVQGTLVLFPTAWTHLHRGNPPFSGNKYIINTWLQFIE